MPYHLPVIRRLATAALLAIALAGGLTVPARSQPTVDTLLARLFGSEDKTPYELTADFSGTLTLVVRGAKTTAVAAGSFVESRGADGVRWRKTRFQPRELICHGAPHRLMIDGQGLGQPSPQK